jgi:hypothetical protein
MSPRESFLQRSSLEVRFLLELLRTYVRNAEKPSIPDEFNWPAFIQLCYATHFAGWCYDQLKSYDTELISPETLQSLKSYQLRVLTSNERLSNQYQELLDIAQREKLTLYPLKGITLMNDCYERVYHRHLSDIDVLIDPKELPTWEAQLLRADFRLKRRVAKSTFHEQAGLKYDPLQAFKQEAVIDFHSSLNSGMAKVHISLSELKKKQQSEHELASIDQLIFVCLHAYKHVYVGQLNPLHLMDIHLLSQKVDEQQLLAQSSTYHCTKEIHSMLELTRFFMGQKDSSIPNWQLAVLDHVLNHTEFTKSQKRQFFYRKHFLIPVSVKQLPSYLWFQVFPSSAYLKQSDGQGNYLLNWLRRIGRLGVRD